MLVILLKCWVSQPVSVKHRLWTIVFTMQMSMWQQQSHSFLTLKTTVRSQHFTLPRRLTYQPFWIARMEIQAFRNKNEPRFRHLVWKCLLWTSYKYKGESLVIWILTKLTPRLLLKIYLAVKKSLVAAS